MVVCVRLGSLVHSGVIEILSVRVPLGVEVLEREGANLCGRVSECVHVSVRVRICVDACD